MDLGSFLRVAVSSLLRNKSRSFLTILGIVIGVAAGVGIIFGILPARRAAKMSPVEALRYE